MLTITFTVEDLARTRLAVSPLWEIVASIRLLRTPRSQTFHQQWARSTKAPDRQGRRRPRLDVLSYARKHPIGTLAEASLPRRLRPARPEDLPSAAVADLYSDPEAGLERLPGQLQTYWELAIAPHWGRIRALLESDLLYRGRRLGQAGHTGLFEDLVESVKWRNGSLSIKHRRFHGVRNLAGEGLLMTPSAFIWPTVFSSTIPPWQPTLTYPARGVATLWANSSRRTIGSLRPHRRRGGAT